MKQERGVEINTAVCDFTRTGSPLLSHMDHESLHLKFVSR